MNIEEFETTREFNKKFPSKLYICSKCQNLTDNPHQCTNCDNQSNSFLFEENAYKFTIKETGLSDQIFKPIELEKGQENE